MCGGLESIHWRLSGVIKNAIKRNNDVRREKAYILSGYNSLHEVWEKARILGFNLLHAVCQMIFILRL